uniref:Uncharacterized protein n=1 Tax=Otus sunia TaxID=257818 RepID=A0A8C8ED97_9STRI
AWQLSSQILVAWLYSCGIGTTSLRVIVLLPLPDLSLCLPKAHLPQHIPQPSLFLFVQVCTSTELTGRKAPCFWQKMGDFVCKEMFSAVQPGAESCPRS